MDRLSIPLDPSNNRDPWGQDGSYIIASKFGITFFLGCDELYSKKMLDFLAISCRENENCSEPYPLRILLYL